jgi:mRNA-degrading endonuclease RelE of RelBE toxin-antitoxin system
MRVELEAQVVAFVRSLAPQPRQTLRRALRQLERERGDIHSLEGALAGFCRLRVLGYRVIFYYRVAGRRRIIRCVYAASRDIIYEVFAQQMRDLLR